MRIQRNIFPIYVPYHYLTGMGFVQVALNVQSALSLPNTQNTIPFSDEFVETLRKLEIKKFFIAQQEAFANWLAKQHEAFVNWMAGHATENNKLHAERAEWMSKAYTVFGSVLAAISLVADLIRSPVEFVAQGLFLSIVNGIGWNAADIVTDVLTAPRLFEEAKHSLVDQRVRFAYAWTNTLYSTTVLPALSLWGFISAAEAVKSVGLKALISSPVTLGAASALAASNFGFAAGMFLSAAISGYDWYHASQKTDPVILLRDRLKKYEVLQLKISECSDNEEREKLQKRLTRMQLQAQALLYYCDKEDSTHRAQLTDEDKNHAAITSPVDPSAPVQSPAAKEKLAAFLIEKQKDKVKEKRLDTIANVIGGVGALFGGLALLIPPVAIPFLIVSVACYAISGAIKLYQLVEKYKLHKEEKKALTEESKNRDALVSDHLGTEISAHALSDSDRKSAAKLQCQSRLFATPKVVEDTKPTEQSPSIQEADMISAVAHLG